MMTVMFLLGIFYVVIGLVLLIAPNLFYKVENVLNKKLADGEAALRHRRWVAVLLLGGGVIMLVVGFIYSGVF